MMDTLLIVLIAGLVVALLLLGYGWLVVSEKPRGQGTQNVQRGRYSR